MAMVPVPTRGKTQTEFGPENSKNFQRNSQVDELQAMQRSREAQPPLWDQAHLCTVLARGTSPSSSTSMFYGCPGYVL